jgi:hypothetical protein
MSRARRSTLIPGAAPEQEPAPEPAPTVDLEGPAGVDGGEAFGGALAPGVAAALNVIDDAERARRDDEAAERAAAEAQVRRRLEEIGDLEAQHAERTARFNAVMESCAARDAETAAARARAQAEYQRWGARRNDLLDEVRRLRLSLRPSP